MGFQMVTWPMTSHDPKRPIKTTKTSDPTAVRAQYHENSWYGTLFSNNYYPLLRGSTVSAILATAWLSWLHGFIVT